MSASIQQDIVIKYFNIHVGRSKENDWYFLRCYNKTFKGTGGNMPKSISKTKDKLTRQWLQQNGIIGENKRSSLGYIHGQTFLYSEIQEYWHPGNSIL